MKTKTKKEARKMCSCADEREKLTAKERLVYDEKAVELWLLDDEKRCVGFLSSLNHRATALVSAWEFVRPSLVKELGGRAKMIASIKEKAFLLATEELSGKNDKGKDVPAVWVDCDSLDAKIKQITARGQNVCVLDGGKTQINTYTEKVVVQGIDNEGKRREFREQQVVKHKQVKISKVVWSIRDVKLAVRALVAAANGKILEEALAAQYVRDGATISNRQHKPSKTVELTANDLNESSEPKQVQQPKDKSTKNSKSTKK